VIRALVLAAVEVEARALAGRLGLARVAANGWSHYRSGALEVLCVGLGAARLEERTAGLEPASVVISAGVCGALAPQLRRGDLVVPEIVVTPDETRIPTHAWPGLSRAGTLLTTRSVVTTPAAKARLWLETGAQAVDMESSIILAWAETRGLPALVVRAVADTAGEAVPADLAAIVDPGGRVHAGRAVRAALARPRALADAIALGRGTDVALQTVASALGKVAVRAAAGGEASL
jgi:adenosylhomocysteine nucleosidase